jgi:ubiquinone/menaquinone biosynthesis C-methylase UbiE
MDLNNLRYSHEGEERQKNGISSFNRLDTAKIFTELNLKKGDIFLDIGCGAGDYSLKAAELVGDKGIVYALDRWEEIDIKLRASNQGNIFPIVADIKESIPLENNSCDVCFVAMVLHGIDLDSSGATFFAEVHRILKSKGRFVIIEIKKEKTPFGPPMEIRYSADEIKEIATKFGFVRATYTDLEHCYMILFETK